ncbi:MAG TPA: glyoxalase [Eubacteriaceae bacterium]|nr:glyoxalase [Eubacteriaceae bacterium]
MSFAHVTILVKNLQESLDFYQNIVGLPIARQFDAGEGTTIAFLGEGPTKVELIYNKDTHHDAFGENISIGFQVESMDQTMEFVKEKGMEVYSGPFEPNPKTKFFYVLDPNGLKVQFVQMS